MDASTSPHNLDAEAAILGGILLENRVLDQLPDLETDDFYHLPHRVVFTAMRNLEAASRPLDVVTIEDEIARAGKLDAIGGVAFLGELALRVPIVDNVLHYADLVRRDARNRRAIVEIASALHRAQTWKHDPDEMIAELRGQLERLEAAPAATSDVEKPWKRELATARADVRRILGTSASSAHAPMFFDAAELFSRPYPETPWLVAGLITRGGIAHLNAEPKSGKTWLATEVAVAVATGTKVCGEFFAERGVVAYFYAEDLDKQVRNRLRASLDGRSMAFTSLAGRLHVCPRGKFLDVTRDEDLAWIVASCRRLGTIDLLVLDPLRDIHSGEEDKSDGMAPVMRRLRALGELLGCTVAIAHHAKKEGKDSAGQRAGQRARGSGAIHGSTDSGLYFGLRGGDGVSRFELEVTSEVKGARSAGRFKLELQLEDNDRGEAIRATWRYSRPTSEAKAPPPKDNAKAKAARLPSDTVDAAVAFVRELALEGEHGPRTHYKNHKRRPPSVPAHKMPGALDQAVLDGRLVLDKAGIVRMPDAAQVEISEPQTGGIHAGRP